MLNEQTVKKLNAIIDQNRERILNVADYIWKNPETGYREWKTTAFLNEQFIKLGYNPVLMETIPGFYADLDTGRPGPTLALLCELDSIICSEHPDSDPETGAVHSCAHHTQCAYLVGAAATLREPAILSELCGKIRFVAVPAEECIELEYRESLREQGIIKYFGGKVEFLYRGVFDGVDAAVMIHSGTGEKTLNLSKGGNGFIAQTITFTGKAAHAASPHNGINALYAATLGIQAINSIRETFQESNTTRVHPIIINGGEAVNVIPNMVCLENFVRGLTVEAIIEECKKVNRALAGAALSLGARVRVRSSMGYMPLLQNEALNEIAFKTGTVMVGEDRIKNGNGFDKGSTDMGDLSSVMPIIQPGGGGGAGTGHGADFRIANPEVACLDSTRCITGIACVLLGGKGDTLREIKENYSPVFATYKDYFTFVDAQCTDRELVNYDGDTASIIW